MLDQLPGGDAERLAYDSCGHSGRRSGSCRRCRSVRRIASTDASWPGDGLKFAPRLGLEPGWRESKSGFDVTGDRRGASEGPNLLSRVTSWLGPSTSSRQLTQAESRTYN
jgi:hypothetical protein